jgi:hypothetical protein
MTHAVSGQNPFHWPFDCANSGLSECGIKVRSCPSEARRLLYALLGLQIGHISGAVDLKENRFSSLATGRSLDSCDCFWMRKDQSRRRVAYLAVSQSHPSSN